MVSLLPKGGRDGGDYLVQMAADYEARIQYIYTALGMARGLQSRVNGDRAGKLRLSIGALGILSRSYEAIHGMFVDAVSENDEKVRDALIMEGLVRDCFVVQTKEMLVRSGESGSLSSEKERTAFERPEVVYGALVDAVRISVEEGE